MAMPILFTLRPTQKDSEIDYFFALIHFGHADSGILFHFEYNEAEALPWGITVNKVNGDEYGYFSNLPKAVIKKFSDAMSTYLNGAYGRTEDNQPIPLPLADIGILTEKVLTFEPINNNQDIELITVCEHQHELVANLKNLPYFQEGAPDFVTNPPAMMDNTQDPSRKTH